MRVTAPSPPRKTEHSTFSGSPLQKTQKTTSPLKNIQTSSVPLDKKQKQTNKQKETGKPLYTFLKYLVTELKTPVLIKLRIELKTVYNKITGRLLCLHFYWKETKL